MKYLFIMSTKAAGGKNLPDENKIQAAMAGEDYEIIYTTYAGQPFDIAKDQAAKYGSDIAIYACGGDGTINEVASALVGTDSFMGVLPCGTGNDFCRTVHDGKTVDQVLAEIKNAQKTKIDIIKMNDRYSINIGSIGFDAAAVYRVVNNVNNVRKYKGMSYLVGALQSLKNDRVFPLSYEFDLVDGRKISGQGEYLLLTLANGSYYGGGFKPAPLADIRDGIIDLTLVETLSYLKVALLMMRYKKGRHLNMKCVSTYEVKSGKIKSLGQDTYLNYDGDVCKTREIEFEILPQAINFLM